MAKVALVTGAGRGIGRAVALRLARDGFDVGINYHRGREGAEEVRRTIEVLGRRAVMVRADVASRGEAEAMAHRVVEELGGINVLVNNAGIYHRTTVGELDLEAWSRTLAVNLSGAFHCSMAVLPAMRKAGGGRMVNVSSQLALRGTDHGPDYAASKAGLLGLTKSLALELAPLNITVNAVAPGTIETDIIAHYTEADRAERRRTIPLGRIGTPEEVADAVAFLASEDSRYITGATLLVTGGGLMV
jgi:3-oxoacyl-[acyl-carrier protein] reductase